MRESTYSLYCSDKLNFDMRCMVDWLETKVINLYLSSSSQALFEKVKSNATRIPERNWSCPQFSPASDTTVSVMSVLQLSMFTTLDTY